jgi:RimJ/RimL family protein N-acetyltransferase
VDWKMDEEKIIGKSIYLRRLKEKDASEDYCHWLNDSVVNKYLETKKCTIEDLIQYIKEKNANDKCRFFGIFNIENDKHIGNVKLEPIDFENKKAIFGILLGEKDCWGQGIGTEVTRLVVKYAFVTLGLAQIGLGVISKNKAAIRVYEKVGFKIVNVEKDKIKHGEKVYDKVVMRIDKKDFENVIAI